MYGAMTSLGVRLTRIILTSLLLALLASFAAQARVEQPQQGLGVWTTYTPTLSCGAGTLTAATATGRYKQIGKIVFLQVTIAITTNGTCATSLSATLPVPVVANVPFPVLGRNVTAINTTPVGVIHSTVSANMVIHGGGGGYPGASATTVALSGIYEAQ